MRSQETAILANVGPVKFSLLQRHPDPFFTVRFRGPDGKRVERSTGKANLKAAKEIAPFIIRDVYFPTEGAARTKPLTWEEVEPKIWTECQGAGLRPRTIQDYQEALSTLKRYVTTLGPADVSDATAKRFKAARMEEVGAGKLSPYTVAGDLRALSSLWSKWLVNALEVVGVNPWTEAPPPKMDKKAKRILTPPEEAAFLSWLEQRYDGWRLPVLWFKVKGCVGSRSLDLSSLPSNALRDGRIVFPADTAKGREERPAILPAALYAELVALKGKDYLWESYTDGLRAYYTKRGGRLLRAARNLKGFNARRLVGFVQDAVNEYLKTHPDVPRFTPHNFRGTAMSRALSVTKGNLIGVSVAFDCHVDTIKTYYADLQKTEIADSVLSQMQAEY